MPERRPPRVLVVCTANVNRSPMAEAWAEHWFAQEFVQAEVRSAGVIGLDVADDPKAATDFRGHPFSRASAFAVEAMRAHGLDLAHHRTRRLKPGTIAWADAVLVMEPRHGQRVVELVPDAADRVVGLWEYADGDLESIWDPQGLGPTEYAASAQLLGDAVHRWVDEFVERRREASRRARS